MERRYISCEHILSLVSYFYIFLILISFHISGLKPKQYPTMSKSNKKQKLEVPTLTAEEKRVVMIQYEKENDSEGAEKLLEEYLKFMMIKIGEKDTNDKKVAPSKKIDEMWHSHVSIFCMI